jgi:hypothetical protein
LIPITITLKDRTGGSHTYVCITVSWRLFKAALRLAGVSSVSLTEDDRLNLAGLMVELFGGRFGIEDLKPCPAHEMIGVLNAIMARVRELSPSPAETDAEDKPAGNWMVDLEISLVKSLNWSLRDIDETSVESLLPFIGRLNGAGAELVYADQVDWL